MASTAALKTLGQILSEQERAVRLQNYDVLGKLQLAKVQRGAGTVAMDFGKVGPMIARHRETGELLLVTPFQGLPDLRGNSEEICQSCAVKCDECKGEGKRPCIYVGCGGRGTLHVNEKPCPGKKCTEATGKFNPACTICRGHGAIPDPTPCPACKGTKMQKCYLCNGTGKKAAGRSADGKTCTACGGHGRNSKMQPQPIAQFKSATIEGMTALGPITDLVWAVARQGEAKFVQCRVNPDSTGHQMVMLLDRPTPGATAYLLGGSPSFDV